MADLFKIEKHVDRETGKTCLSVRVDGRECETFIFRGPIAARYVGFSLILKDLEDSLWWIRKAYALLPKRSKSEDQNSQRVSHIDSTGQEDFKMLKAYYGANSGDSLPILIGVVIVVTT